MVYVYTLSASDRGEVRYVGITRSPENRAKSHLKPDGSHKGAWVKSVLARGAKPILTVIEESSESFWQDREQFWIAEYKRRGARLTNGDCGGLNRLRHSEELKSKISKTLTGRPNLALAKKVHAYDVTGTYVASYESVAAAANHVNGSHSNIVRAVKTSRLAYGFLWAYVMTEKIPTPGYIDGHRVVSQETRAKLSAASKRRMLGFKFSDESKERMRKSALRRWHGQEVWITIEEPEKDEGTA